MLPETRDDYCDKLLKKHYIECKKAMEFDVEFSGNLGDILIDSNYYHGNFDNMSKRIDLTEMCEMTFGFLNSYKPSLSNLLKNMLNENRVIVMNNGNQLETGLTVCSTTKFSPYIIIYLFKNIIDPVTLIHEMGHVYHFQKIEQLRNNQYYKIIYNNQLEVYSHYLELLSYDYFSKTYNERDILNIKRLMIKTFVEFYKSLELNLENFNLETYMNYYDDFYKDYAYGRGMLLAFEFYDMYQNDKEKAEYNIERFISENGKHDFYTTLGKYDLNRERIERGESIRKYMKKIF